MRSAFYSIIFLLVSFNAFSTSVDKFITITQTSSSGKTLLIDKGLNNYIKFDDYGILLKVFNVDGKKIFKPIAKIKAVKVFGETSIWITFKVFMPQHLKQNERLMLLSESSLLTGRSELKITRSKIIGHESDLKTQLVDSLTEDSKGLSKKEPNYRVEKNLHDRQKHYASDVELIDIDAWDDKEKNNNYKTVPIYKSPYAKEFSDKKRVETFEKMVVAFIRKYNDPKFTMASFYYQQRKNKDIDILKDRTTNGSYFDRYLEGLEAQKIKEEKIFKDLQSNGESWSDGYSDEELGELIYNVGAIRERERRQEITAEQFDHQIYANFGLNLINNENIDDSDSNTEQSKFDIEFGWEYYFLKKIKNLNRLSVEFSGRRASDAFTIGDGYNVTSVEYSLATHVNWYPFVKPNTLEKNIVFLSLLFRAGLSRLKLSQTQEEGNYQISSLPGLRGGVKYNFSNGYGIRLIAGFENINVSRLIREYDGGLLPDRENYLEGKLSFGLSKFF